MIKRIQYSLILIIFLTGCGHSILSERRQRSLVYVPHSTNTHPVAVLPGMYTTKRIQTTEVYYGPHRPMFFTDASENISEMPDHLDTLQFHPHNKHIIVKRRIHHMPGTKLTRAR